MKVKIKMTKSKELKQLKKVIIIQIFSILFFMCLSYKVNSKIKKKFGLRSLNIYTTIGNNKTLLRSHRYILVIKYMAT